MLFVDRHAQRACLPAQAAEQLLGSFVWLFFFFPLLSLSWELIVHFQQQPGDPGDNSAATWPGTSTTWTRFRHLASHKEGGRQSGSIPSAPKANKLHRLTPAATKTCRNYLGCSRSHGDELLHVFLSVGRRFGIPLCLLPRGVSPCLLHLSDVRGQILQEQTQGQEDPETCQPPAITPRRRQTLSRKHISLPRPKYEQCSYKVWRQVCRERSNPCL